MHSSSSRNVSASLEATERLTVLVRFAPHVATRARDGRRHRVELYACDTGAGLLWAWRLDYLAQVRIVQTGDVVPLDGQWTAVDRAPGWVVRELVDWAKRRGFVLVPQQRSLWGGE